MAKKLIAQRAKKNTHFCVGRKKQPSYIIILDKSQTTLNILPKNGTFEVLFFGVFGDPQKATPPM